jgi:hypothetical protein
VNDLRRRVCCFLEVTIVAILWSALLVIHQRLLALLILLPTNPLMARLYAHVLTTDVKLWKELYHTHSLGGL